MNTYKKLYFINREEWREWLQKHHLDEKAVWLIYYKKHTRKKTISYSDAVEEAICFGWIDGQVKKIDDDKYMQRYTPRRTSENINFVNTNPAFQSNPILHPDYLF